MTSRADTFDRADGAIGSPSDGGSAWEETSGNWEIFSNQAGKQADDNNNQECMLETSASNGEASIDIMTNSVAGPVVRGVDVSNYWLAQRNSGTLTIFLKSGGSYSNQGSGSITHTNGDTYALEATSGNDINAKHEGSQIATVNSSTHSTATKAGMYSFQNAGRLDNFVFTDPAAGADPEGKLVGGKLIRGGLLRGGVLIG